MTVLWRRRIWEVLSRGGWGVDQRRAMAVDARPELVGKRFLCVGGDEPPEIGDIARWSWRSGVIRAVNHRDSDNPDLTVWKMSTVCSMQRKGWNLCRWWLASQPLAVRLVMQNYSMYTIKTLWIREYVHVICIYNRWLCKFDSLFERLPGEVIGGRRGGVRKANRLALIQTGLKPPNLPLLDHMLWPRCVSKGPFKVAWWDVCVFSVPFKITYISQEIPDIWHDRGDYIFVQTCWNSSSLLVKRLSSLLYRANRLMGVQAVSLDLCIVLIKNRIIWAKCCVCVCVFWRTTASPSWPGEGSNARTCKNIKLARCMVNNGHLILHFNTSIRCHFVRVKDYCILLLISKQSIFKMKSSKIYRKIFFSFNFTF